jgi:hypothetical protein
VPDWLNSTEFRQAVFPSANWHGAARGIARIYAALANDGYLDGVTVLSPTLIDEIRAPAWEGICGRSDTLVLAVTSASATQRPACR